MAVTEYMKTLTIKLVKEYLRGYPEVNVENVTYKLWTNAKEELFLVYFLSEEFDEPDESNLRMLADAAADASPMIDFTLVGNYRVASNGTRYL